MKKNQRPYCPGCCRHVPAKEMVDRTNPYEPQNLLICKNCMIAEQRGSKLRERQS